MKITRCHMAIAALAFLAMVQPVAAADAQPHNVILFVPDGLRATSVTPDHAPAMAALRLRGVDFPNSHALFPTFTTANASGMATGHYLGDTGDFSNTIFAGFPVHAAGDSVVPFLENDAVLGDVDDHFAGDYLDETTLLKAARDKGFSTAAIGKIGPVLIFDHTDRSGDPTIIIDDATGGPAGIPLSPAVTSALTVAGLPAKTPPRGDNGKSGSIAGPGTTVPNTDQQDYFVAVTTRILLPMFKERGKPFMLVFWSRDPDGTQHNQGDSFDRTVPGINGPSSLAAIRNADNDLAAIEAAVAAAGLGDQTDIVVAADHGFSTISKESATSAAARAHDEGVLPGHLPPGFLALDLATALGLPLFDPNAQNAAVAPGHHPQLGNGLIGDDAGHPKVVVAANGGSDLVYLPAGDKALTDKVIDILLGEDYVSGLFVDRSLGVFPGTLPLDSVNLLGTARTPLPAIFVNFRSYADGCSEPVRCAVEVADTGLQQGQGMHGSFSRADTQNFMAAAGPDFKAGFVDPAPVSNADIGRTLAAILGLDFADHGKLIGRTIAEARPGAGVPAYSSSTLRSAPGTNGLSTLVNVQTLGGTRYFDAAGFPGRTVGLRDAP